jgi:hypothetical protein
VARPVARKRVPMVIDFMVALILEVMTLRMSQIVTTGDGYI